MRTAIGLGSGLLSVVVSLAACGGGAGPNCNAADLTAALAAAMPGDTVELGACKVTGAFVVPAGVTLAGAGEAKSTIVAAPDAVALTLTPGAGTTLRDLTVESDGRAAVVASGDGGAGVALARITIDATRGVGVGMQDLASADLSSVTMRGPVLATNANMVPPTPSHADTATHGLVLLRVANATLTDVSIAGFADFGALLIDSTTTWTTGGATDNLGTNAMVYGGAATLTDVDLSRSLQGTRLIPAYGGVWADGASVTTTRLKIDDSQRYGVLQSGATAQHTDLEASGNHDAALWVQQSMGFGLVGPNSVITGNKFAGVVIVDSSNVTISDAHIGETVQTSRPIGMTTVDFGDGVQLIRSTTNVLLQRVMLPGNARVGVLLDVGGAMAPPLGLFDQVVVSGTGAQLGAIAQGMSGVVPSGGWDDGIMRQAATLANDAALMSPLNTGLVGPNSVDVPSDVATGGLAALGL